MNNLEERIKVVSSLTLLLTSNLEALNTRLKVSSLPQAPARNNRKRKCTMMNRSRSMRNSLRKNRRLLISKHGNVKMELDSTKEFLSLKEATASSEELWFKRDGLRMKMSGHPITISNGPPEYATSTI